MRDFLKDAEYETGMRERILPRLAASRRQGVFTGARRARLAYTVYDAPKPRGSVFILHGFTEYSEKYEELAGYFLEDGFSVYLFDQRGHGRSVRECAPDIVYVRRFTDYVDDLEAFLETVGGDAPAPRYLFAHSMGGAVAALFLERGSTFFSRAVLNTPMIATRRGKCPAFLCRALCGFARVCGQGKKPIPGLRGRSGKSFEQSNVLSHARFTAYRALKKQFSYQQYPSYSWMNEALHVPRVILRRGAPESIRIPVRVYIAEKDVMVDRRAAEKFIARVPRGESVLLRGAKHETYASSDEILAPFFDGLLSYFEEEDDADAHV